MPEFHGHNCDAPVNVVLHDAAPDIRDEIIREAAGSHFAIPIIDDGIELHEWKDGPMSITRRAEVSFPIEGLGTSWYEYVDAFDEGGGWQKATILMTPTSDVYRGTVTEFDLPSNILGDNIISPDDLETIPMMTGYVGAVGADGANTGHLTIYGAYNLLSSIPVGERIDAQDDLDSVFQWFTSEFVDGQPLFDELPYEIRGREAIRRNLAEKYSGDSPDSVGFVTGTDTRSFSTNRDTMADVSKWIREELGIELRFQVQDDWSIKLVGNIIEAGELFDEGSAPDRLFKQRSREAFLDVINSQLDAPTIYNATHDGNLQLIENQALYEIRPYNTLILKGTEMPRDSAVKDVIFGGEGVYPEAKAVHPELVERAGGEMPLVRESNISTPAKLESAARAQLQDLLSGASVGTMMFPFAPFIHPGDNIVAKPACEGMVADTLPELTYEVERAVHMVTPNPENNTGTNVPRTDVSVTLSALGHNIETTSTVKKMQPSESEEGEPVGDQDTDDYIDFIWSVY